MAQKRIEFQGVDNGLTATMERFRQKAKEITSNMLDDSRNYSKSGREQLQLINEQIDAQEKRNALDKEYEKLKANQTFGKESAQNRAAKAKATEIFEREKESPHTIIRQGAGKKYKTSLDEIKGQSNQSKEKLTSSIQSIDTKGQGESVMSGLLKEQIETIKRISKEEIAEDRRNIIRNVRAFKRATKRGDFTGFSPVDVAKKRYQAELLEESSPTKKENAAGAAFTGMMGAMMVDKIAGGIAQIPSAETGLEVIKPLASAIGALTGGAIGSAIDFGSGISVLGTGGGQTNMTVPMMKAFQTSAELASDAYVRHRKSADAMEGRLHQIQALTGGHAERAGLAELGVGDIAAAEKLAGVIRTGGFTTAFGEQQTKELYATEKLYNIPEGELMRSMQLMRMTGDEDLRETVGRAKAGVELGFMDEHDRIGMQGLFKGINSMTEVLSKNKTTVNKDEIAATMLTLNAGGGQFSIRDPRSMQNMMQMQQGLTNPQNDFIKAMQFSVARDTLGEGAGYVDILKMQQQGMGDMNYVKKIFSTMQAMGGDEDFQTMSIAQMFGLQGNLAAASELFGMREGIVNGTVTEEDIARVREGMPSSKTYVKEAEAMVTALEKQEARIGNAFITGMWDGVIAVSNQFGTEMEKTIDDVAKYFYDRMTGDGKDTPQEELNNEVVKYRGGEKTVTQLMNVNAAANRNAGVGSRH